MVVHHKNVNCMNVDELMIITELAKNNYLSRRALSEKLGLGEGVVRSLLNSLKSANKIASFQSGHRLIIEIESLPRYAQIDATPLTLGYSFEIG